MDRTERSGNPAEILRLALESNQRTIWTALPALILNVPGTAGPSNAWTADVQPTINGLVQDDQGNRTWQQMPVLMDCPLMFQGGGGVTLTMPVTKGDECLVVISSRCIDLWWKLGGIQNQAELRMHNLSDGFAFVGCRSLPRVFALDMANACLISDNGQTYFKLNPNGETISAQANEGITLNGVTIDRNGNLTSPATIHAVVDVTATAAVTALSTHDHPVALVQGGSSTIISNPPVPGS